MSRRQVKIQHALLDAAYLYGDIILAAKAVFTFFYNPQSIGKHSIVRELSMYAGKLLLFFHCSPQVSHTTMLNLIRGMAATGKYTVCACGFRNGSPFLPAFWQCI